MIKYLSTLMGQSYNHYLGQYLEGLARNTFETYEIGDTLLLGVNRSKGELPKTNLPYVVLPEHEFNTRKKTIVLIDSAGLRDSEADLRYINMILTGLWEDPHLAERFHSVRKFATRSYMNWVSRGLHKRFALSLDDKMDIDILTAIYFYCAGSTPSEVLDAKNYKAYADLAEITDKGALRVKNIIERYQLDRYEGTLSFKALIEMIQQVSDDARHKITVQSVMATLSRSWYGEGGVFYCNLALEYPPMFISLLYFSLTDKTYTRTGLGTVTSEFSVGRNRNVGVLFTKQLHSLIKDANPKSV